MREQTNVVGSPCPVCGTLPEEDARFCVGCGRRLAGPTTVPRDLSPLPAPVPTQPLEPPPELRRSPAPAPPASVRAPGAPDPTLLATLVEEPSTIAARMGQSLETMVGRTLNNRYLVQGKIGEGGFGAVFEARQVATGREVALKVLHPHNVADTTVVARFRREAEACSRLRNEHTVTIYDFDETPDGTLYLAMELVRGRSLQQLQKEEGPLGPARTLKILHQIADALAEAHEQGLVHRDMKPENVMVETRDGEDFVKVLDFGITKIISGDAAKKAPNLTAFGQTVGTLEFMSPEQLRGLPLDGRSDLYAVGMMVYEMLTGDLPFVHLRAPTEIIQFHLQEMPVPPSRARPDLKIPALVDEVVLKLVAKSPDDRPADAGELRRMVERTIAALRSSAARRDLLRIVAVIGALALLATAIVAVAMR